MTSHLLSRRAYRPKPGVSFLGDLRLSLARAHEFCGPARRTLALMLARAMDGPIFWISSGWHHDRLNGEGIAGLTDPGRITYVTPARAEDMLWTMEEVLRAGCVPLAVCDGPAAPGLTSVRRLHLAAETAHKEHRTQPIGLLLCPGEGGAQGVESRWHMEPAHAETQNRWCLSRRHDRLLPPQTWRVKQMTNGFALEEGHARSSQTARLRMRTGEGGISAL